MAGPKRPLVLCVINLKGGVGKSTVAALLARHAFERRHKSVLAIDLDPQANLSQAFMRRDYNGGVATVGHPYKKPEIHFGISR